MDYHLADPPDLVFGNPTRERVSEGPRHDRLSLANTFWSCAFSVTLPLAGESDAVAAGEGPLRA